MDNAVLKPGSSSLLLESQQPGTMGLELQSPICTKCRSLQLSTIDHESDKLIESDHSFWSLMNNSIHCACCDFLTKHFQLAGRSPGWFQSNPALERIRVAKTQFTGKVLILNPIPVLHNEFQLVCVGKRPTFSKSWSHIDSVHGLVDSGASLDQMIRCIKGWLTECASHSRCREHGRDCRLPDRILDVEHHAGHITLRELSAVTGDYIALSYCWGTEGQYTLTKDTFDALTAGLSLDTLPETIQNAVAMTRKLGVRFLWVDAVCILQDSSEDWQRQSAKMGSIYKNAYLTIYASRAASVHEGFLGPRLPNEVYVGQAKHEGYAQSAYLREGGSSLDGFLGSEPLTSRGWALQEQVLSPRKVFFGSKQMFWQCHMNMHSESGTSLSRALDLQWMVESSGPNSEPVEGRWLRMVSRYTNYKLTRFSDRLPALSGLTAEFAKVEGLGEFLAGNWGSHLLVSLLWNAKDNDLMGGPTNDSRGRPSWSWSSFNGRIDYFNRLPNLCKYFRPLAQVLGVQVTPSGVNLFGEVTEGTIELRAPVFRTRLGDLGGDSADFSRFCQAFGLQEDEFPDIRNDQTFPTNIRLCRYDYDSTYPSGDHAPLLFVVLGRYTNLSIKHYICCGIIVTPCKTSDETFQRVGMFYEMYDVMNIKREFERVRVV